MEIDPRTLFEEDLDLLDEAQRRIMIATREAYNTPVLFAKIHEHDEIKPVEVEQPRRRAFGR